jgi:hypothetical protein
MEERLLVSFEDSIDPFALRDFLGGLSGRPAVMANLRQREAKVFFTIRCQGPFDRGQTRQIEGCHYLGRQLSSTSRDKAKTHISRKTGATQSRSWKRFPIGSEGRWLIAVAIPSRTQ